MNTDQTTPEAQLTTLKDAFLQLQAGQLGMAAFSALVQNQQQLRDALPPRFDEVLMQLLNGLESSALFSEESCSFSQQDLLASLSSWLDKAGLNLAKANL